MKIDNLEKGMVIKNYKELCKMLEIKTTTGEAKQNQLKELAELVEYHKDGNKFVIDNIEKLSDVGYLDDNNNNIYYSANSQNTTTFKKKDEMTRGELEELEWNTILSNIHNLYDGRTYTYPQICKALEIERKTGDSKKAQLKQIERLIALERKKGAKFMVIQHYSVAFPKEDNRMDKVSRRTFGNMLLYGLMVEYFGINGIDEEYEVIEGEGINRDIKDIVITRSKLYEHMDMVNPNYKKYKRNHKVLAEETKAHEIIIDDLYLKTELQLKGYVSKALSDLKDRRIIVDYNDCTKIVLKNGAKRLATDKETTRIAEAEKMVLKDMNIESIYQVMKQNRNEEFYRRVADKLTKLSKDKEEFKGFENIKMYYKAINIRTTEFLLHCGYSELVEDVVKSMAEANDLVLEGIVKHYNKDDCKYANRLIEEVNKKNKVW